MSSVWSYPPQSQPSWTQYKALGQAIPSVKKTGIQSLTSRQTIKDGSAACCASNAFTEKAARDFIKDKKPSFDVATICPPKIYGRLYHDANLNHLNTTCGDIGRFMYGSKKEPGPAAFPAFTDIRDVGEAHAKAYGNPQGSRYFIATGNFQHPGVWEIDKRVLPAKLRRCQTFRRE